MTVLRKFRSRWQPGPVANSESPEPGTVPLRDNDGRMQAAPGVAPNDVATVSQLGGGGGGGAGPVVNIEIADDFEGFHPVNGEDPDAIRAWVIGDGTIAIQGSVKFVGEMGDGVQLFDLPGSLGVAEMGEMHAAQVMGAGTCWFAPFVGSTWAYFGAPLEGDEIITFNWVVRVDQGS